MLRQMAELRQHGSQTWKVSETPPEMVIRGYGWDTYTGKDITLDGAMSVSAAYACIRGIAETHSILPKILYQRTAGGGKRRAFEHPVYAIVHDALNPEHTAQVGWELGGANALGWGNAYYQIIRNKAGDVQELWPLSAERMEVERVAGVRVYHYRQADSSKRDFPQDQIMHVPGFGFDGLVGYSPLQMARNALALSMAAEEFGGKFFANDARPGIVLQHPKTLNDKAQANLKQSYLDSFQGSEKSHGLFVAEEGMTVKEIGIPPEDAQFLQTRSYQVAEIARFYRFPLALLEEHDKAATYASVEQFMLSFVIHTILPWATRFDQAINHSLLTKDERGQYFCETLMDSLLRGDIATRYGAYAIGRQWGWLSADDVLAMENRNPLPNGQGKIYMMPLNMVPASVQKNFEPVVAETAERIARRELHDLREGVRKASATTAASWLQEFYEDHASFVARALQSAVESYARLSNRERVPDVREMARDYAEHNRQALEGMGPDEILPLLERWERELPGLLVQMTFGLFEE